MDPLVLRARVRANLAAGRLPHEARVRLWSAPHRPERCDACDEPIVTTDAVMQCVGKQTYGLHVECMYVWYLERLPSSGWTTMPEDHSGHAL